LLNKSLAVGIVFLFIVSSTIPMVLGYDVESEIQTQATALSDGPMDSVWPMKSHDNHHTGRSPHSTSDNPGIEKWRFKCGEISGWVEGGIVIGDDGTLYFGDLDYYFYALNPDGSLKWKYKTGGHITSTPAIAEDGTIYVGAWDDYLHAFYPNNGTRKWKFNANSANIASSPAIAEDGTIYFGTLWSLGNGGKIFAVNPDGTEKWRYQTGGAIVSDPAIGDDGTIYIGSLDNYLYALYPNGTLRWRFKTGDDVKSPPSIAEDGTIYFGSFDDNLYALNPDGTLRWKVGTSFGTSANPSIADDGTIYAGTNKLRAFHPNGNLKWSFNLGPEQWIGSSSPAISADGTIYFGTRIGEGNEGGEIIAVNPDGTERWRKRIAANYYVDSSPCIGEDGTVYIGSTYDQGRGYLHAFGSVESNEPPETPTISGKINGKPLENYWYSFTVIDPDRNPISFYIDWGDGTNGGWTSERASGEKCYYEHTWLIRSRYTIRVKAKDVMGAESDWATLEVSMPKNKIINPFERFLENYPYMFPLLRQIFGLQ